MSKSDAKKPKFSAKKSIPWSNFDWQNMDFDKVETKPIPGGDKGDYNNLLFGYKYAEDETGELRIKWPDLDNCWIGPYYDEKKDQTTWSITHYYETGSDEKFELFILDLSKGHLGLIEENKDKLEANNELADKNFDPSDIKSVSDLWAGFSRRPKKAPKTSTRRKIKFKSFKGGKPSTKRFLTDEEVDELIKKDPKIDRKTAEKKTKDIDADYLVGKRCKLRIISRHPQIYCGEKIHPQMYVYSAIVLDLDETGQPPEDLFDDEVDDLFTSGREGVKKSAGKLAALESAGKPVIDAKKPAAAEGSKGGDKDEKKDKGDSKPGGIAAKIAEKNAKAKEAAKKAAEKKAPEPSKKDKSPKADDDSD